MRQFRQEMGRPIARLRPVSSRQGPVTRVTRHRATWLSSEIVLDIAEYAGINAVELRFVIDWREHRADAEARDPHSAHWRQPRLFAKVPGTVLERKTNGEEEPYQDWAAIEGHLAGSIAGQTDGRTKGHTDGRTKGHTDGRTARRPTPLPS